MASLLLSAFGCGSDGSTKGSDGDLGFGSWDVPPGGDDDVYYQGGDGGCTPDCDGKKCGDNGCGGVCGKCSGGTPFCHDFLCVADCTASCSGKQCGDDGCGGSCGTCSGAKPFCEAGVCMATECVPSCGDRECGDDGCGGSCGSCPLAAPKCEAGACVVACQRQCQGKECGDDGCGGTCGTCAANKECTLGVCKCTPQYSEDCCGDDVCYFDSCGVKGAKIAECPLSCKLGECEVPQKVAIYIEGALVGPAGLDGVTWDGFSTVNQGLMDLAMEFGSQFIDSYVGIPGVGSIVGYVANSLLSGYEPPDPFGTGQFMSDGAWSDIIVDLPMVSDTYNPQWNSVGWINLPYKKGLKVKVNLTDDDLMGDDVIGSAIVGYDSIEAALYSGQKFTVPVGDQTFNTLLAVVISVHPMGSTCKPDCLGKVCGPDGCGGSCGTCDEGMSCSDGFCVAGISACPGIWDCVANCADGDDPCVEACISNADQESQDAFYAMVQCLVDEGYYDCSNTTCEDAAIEACTPAIRDCYHGNLTCGGVYNCVGGCNDNTCINDCFYEGSVDAQYQVEALEQCFSDTCGEAPTDECLQTAINENCASEAEPCL
jgi:hypothetical protein